MTKEDKTFEAEVPKEKSTWDLIVETANTPEEKADIRRVYRDSEINELERLKSEQIKTYPNKIGYYRSDGTKADFKTFNEINRPIRQRVTEKSLRGSMTINTQLNLGGTYGQRQLRFIIERQTASDFKRNG